MIIDSKYEENFIINLSCYDQILGTLRITKLLERSVKYYRQAFQYLSGNEVSYLFNYKIMEWMTKILIK